MTIAERFRIEGRQEGRQEGKQEGLQLGLKKGMEDEKIIIAKRLLAEKFDLAMIAKVTELSIDQIRQLEEKLH